MYGDVFALLSMMEDAVCVACRYHLTDVPCFCSGRHVVYFDPHCQFLPNASASNPGKRIDYVKHDVRAQYPDQFKPLCAFGCDVKSQFNGTLFRFALRTKEQVKLSL